VVSPEVSAVYDGGAYAGTWYPSGQLYQNGAVAPDMTNMYAIDTNGAVLVSYDGGKTCVKTPATMPVSTGMHIVLNSISAYSDATGIVGLAAYVSKDITAVCRGNADTGINMVLSSDAGQTWTTSSVPAPAPTPDLAQAGYSPDSTYPLKVQFMDSRHGWLVLLTGYQMLYNGVFVYTTSDGGQTWAESPVGDILICPGTMGGYLCVGFSSADIGFVGIFGNNGPVVLRTIDGGRTWDSLTFSLPEQYQDYSNYTDSPVFDGADGVMPVHVESVSADGTDVAINLVTHDYGVTWAVGSTG